MYVIPAPGLSIVDPDRHDVIPPEGRDVPEQPYWHHRLRDRDVTLKPVPVILPPPAPAPPVPPAPATDAPRTKGSDA
jgi:hypothetical protein